LPLKNRVALKIFTVLNMFFTFRILEQLALALRNRVCPELNVLNMYFLSFRIFEQLALALKTECALNFLKPGDAAAPPRPPTSYAYVSGVTEPPGKKSYVSGDKNIFCQCSLLISVTGVIGQSVWSIIVYCFFTVGSVKFLQLLFVIFVGRN